MAKKKRRPVYGKLQKTIVLQSNKNLGKYAPPTITFNKPNFHSMLIRYRLVYVKPNYGCHGIGVMKIEKVGNTYKFQTGLEKKQFNKQESLFKYIKKVVGNKNFIIQKGIRIIHYKGRPFDIRVMVQKNMSTKKWNVTGIAGRLAAPKRIVTNFNKGRNGASIVRTSTLLSPHFSKKRISEEIKTMKSLGIRVSKHFQKKYPRLKEIGLDVAYDQNKRKWLLEVNTTYPSAFMFKFLKNKKMYNRMKRYKKTYKD